MLLSLCPVGTGPYATIAREPAHPYGGRAPDGAGWGKEWRMFGDANAGTLVLLALFVVLSAFFSGSEAAMLSVQRVRLRHLVNLRTPGAARVARMVEHPDRLLPPILLGNNLVNTAVASLSTALALSLIPDEGRAILIATVAATVVLLILGETIPKTVAARHAETTAILAGLPLQGIAWVLTPASWVLGGISRAVAGLFGGSGDRSAVTEEEIKTLVLVGHESGAVEEAEAEMIRRVLEFGDRRVREVMTPRPEIVWVEMGTSIRAFLDLYNERFHTRFPVYQGRQDNVVGVVAVKDVVRMLAQGADLESPATNAYRPAVFVPETKRVYELFQELRGGGDQLAMVADEFGGVAGLVTLKRLVESIVGRVDTTEESAIAEVVETGEGSFEMEGGLAVTDANERLGGRLPTGEYETLAGFLLERLGAIPTTGAEVEHAGLRFTVLEMRGVRIGRVRVERMPEPDAPEDE